MKKLFITLVFCFFTLVTYGQIGIGTINPHASAVLDLESTNKGFLPPVMTNTEIDAIDNPALGLIAYSTDENCLTYYNGSKWMNVCTHLEINTETDYTSSPTRLKANNIGANDHFGISVTLSGDGNTLVVGAYGEASDALGVNNNNEPNSGAVYVYRKIGGAWSSPIRLKSPNPGNNDRFGWKQALSNDGNTLVVSSYWEDSDASSSDNDNIANSGSIYVFKYSGGSWGTPTRLKSNNIGVGDAFGESLDLSGDGNTLVVASPGDDSDGSGGNNNNITNSGAVDVFKFNGGVWGAPIRLKANNTGEQDYFGYSCSLSEDGNILAVGAYFEGSDAVGVDNENAFRSGAVYIFKYSGSSWGTPIRLKSDNIESEDRFGTSVSLNADGNTLAVGAYLEDSDAQGVNNNNALNSGAVYIFTNNGSTWSNPTRLKANNIGASDFFGWSVALNSDGNTLAVGAFYEDSDAVGVDNDGSSNSGAVYVFRKTGGVWSLITRLKANNIGNEDIFGGYISLSNDGNTLVVGSNQEDSDALGVDNDNASNSGAAYIFE
ncbi:MAG: hypothetical protein ACPG6V_02270 [Flavobacteriales bacterium]